MYVAFYAARVASDDDLVAVLRKLEAVREFYADGVGVFLYRALDPKRPTAYTKIDPGEGLRIDEVLQSFSERVARS